MSKVKITDPAMVFATDRTNLDAVIESLDGKGLARSVNQTRVIVWMPSAEVFHGFWIDYFVKCGFDYDIRAVVYPNGRVVKREVK